MQSIRMGMVVAMFSLAVCCAQEGDAQTRAVISLLPQANAEQVALFQQGADVWNRYRQENPDVAINLFGITEVFGSPINPFKFSIDNILPVGGIDFMNMNLQNAILRRAVLAYTDFTKGMFNNADMTAAFPYFSNFTGAVFDGAVMINTDMTRSDFTNASLKKVLMRSAICLRTTFEGANLQGANCVRAIFFGVLGDKIIMRTCRVDALYFFAVALTNADFTNAYGIQTLFENSSFDGSNFSSATFLQAVCTLTTFINANFSNTDFSQSTFIGCTFNNASCIGTNFSNTFFGVKGDTITTFENTNFAQADLFGADMSNVDFFGADLSAARNLTTARLTGAFYGSTTKFPQGFDPVAAGMILVG